MVDVEEALDALLVPIQIAREASSVLALILTVWQTLRLFE